MSEKRDFDGGRPSGADSPCGEWGKRIAAGVVGEPPPDDAEREAVEAHVASCPRCAERAARMVQAAALLLEEASAAAERPAGALRLDADRRARVRAAAEREMRRTASRPRWRRIAAAAALLLAAGGAGAAFWATRPREA